LELATLEYVLLSGLDTPVMTFELVHHEASQQCGRIPERLRNIDFAVYEKNEGIGGVW